MGFISAEPIVLIGSGSEWFWTMAQFLVVAITLIGIYYQLRLQRAMTAFEELSELNHEWDAEFLVRAQVSVVQAILAGSSLPRGALSAIGNFWDKSGGLVRAGHMDAGVVYESLGGFVPFWWTLLHAEAERFREAYADPAIWNQFEWLADLVTREDARKGVTAQFDRATVMRQLPTRLEALADRLALLEATRTIAVSNTNAANVERSGRRRDRPSRP